MTREEQLSIKPNEDFIPNVGLGEFIVGYTGKKDKFPQKMLWWLLLPILGWFVVVSFVVAHYISHLFVGKYTNMFMRTVFYGLNTLHCFHHHY